MKTATEANELSSMVNPEILPGFKDIEASVEKAIAAGRYETTFAKSFDLGY